MRRRIPAVGLALLILGAATLVPAGRAEAATGAFTRTETITRTDRAADGTITTIDTRTFQLSVDTTTDLRGRQQIGVSWTGAHPTGGIVTDPNSASASRQEYPVVLLECRGLDTAAAPVNQHLDPTTCWTQTPDERHQESFQDSFPEWRLDRYESAADRAAKVDVPTGTTCDDGATTTRYVPFVALDKTVYYGGTNGVCGIAPEASTVEDPAAPPANTTYAATGTDGKGQARFLIWTAEQNASLGCSDTVPCALVVVPIMGISCDASASDLPPEDRPAPGDEADAAAANCRKTGAYAPGEPFSTDSSKLFGDTAVTGALWWSASNWRNRITVPLTFAPPANVCDILDSRVPVDLYGSELMNQAGSLWQAKFCQDPRFFKFEHVATDEPEAASALATGAISAALLSQPPPGGYAGPTVTAPVAVTGFAISYVVDDAHKHEYTTLKLNPRLIAKLLSESYWGRQALEHDYAALKPSNPYAKMAHNPQDITVDPEFVKLNPGIGTTVQTQAASTLLALSGQSDVMYALTQYINADPDARAFLNGTPDPWGMVVNPTYRKIALPRASWPLLDTFISPDIDLDGCLRNDKQQIVGVPILPLIAAPVASMTTIAQDMQYAIANSQTSCSPLLTTGGLLVGGSLKPLGREQPGARFMLGITSVGDTALYGLRNAALESTSGHYVLPTTASMLATMKLTTLDTRTHTWPIPYPKLRTSVAAYPGTMVVYAAIPTTGLATTLAEHLAQFLDYAAGPGQVPGVDVGLLPPGYAPMTAANGLGALVTYTTFAAELVAAQNGPTLPRSTAPPTTSTHHGSGGGTPTKAPAGPTATASPPYIPPVDEPIGYTASVTSTAASWALPVAVLVCIVAMVVAIAIRTVSSMKAASSAQARLDRLNARRDAGSGGAA